MLLENSAPPANAAATVIPSRPKRVRTGCLTCRERHLKCDEGLPICLNCQKSNRECKRGVRLNFIDTQVQDPEIIPPTQDWNVHFQDESREIASEYRGGLGRYGAVEPKTVIMADAGDEDTHINANNSGGLINAPVMSHQHHPVHSPPTENTTQYSEGPHNMPEAPRISHHQHNHSSANSTYSTHTITSQAQSAYSNPEHSIIPANEATDFMNSPEEVLFLQVFVEEVGLWMDSMDPYKHFSRLLPFHALGEPMLLNALLACGARHLTLVNPAYHEDKALHYYDTATRGLLASLQNPNRDTVICATAAVVLNVYEIMSVKNLQRMNHIAGARALIKECGWNARSVGIGAACFWLNVGMELLSCLHFNWQVAWDPDDWGVNMDLTQDTRSGQEELWTYRIVYITAKIANFRASIPRFTEANQHTEARLRERYEEWNRLKALCDTWNSNIPRTMHPMAYLTPYQTASKSCFPEVWQVARTLFRRIPANCQLSRLIKRTTIVARLFYHTAMCLLPQAHPTALSQHESNEMRHMQLSHSRQICGIVAHVKDRGVASTALRCLAIAAECLVIPEEQQEILTIFEKIQKETGWRVDFLGPELKKKWGWVDDHNYQQPPPAPSMMPTPPPYNDFYQQQGGTSLPPAPPQPAMPQIPRGIVNPLMKLADFKAPQHPYMNHYVAPAQQQQHSHQHHSHFLY